MSIIRETLYSSLIITVNWGGELIICFCVVVFFYLFHDEQVSQLPVYLLLHWHSCHVCDHLRVSQNKAFHYEYVKIIVAQINQN